MLKVVTLLLGIALGALLVVAVRQWDSRPVALSGAAVAGLGATPSPAPRWLPVADVFLSEHAAHAFGRRLRRESGLDVRVVALATRGFQVEVDCAAGCDAEWLRATGRARGAALAASTPLRLP